MLHLLPGMVLMVFVGPSTFAMGKEGGGGGGGHFLEAIKDYFWILRQKFLKPDITCKRVSNLVSFGDYLD